MGRHGVAEILTGALVLAIALGFLAYAVAHSGRTTGTGGRRLRRLPPSGPPLALARLGFGLAANRVRLVDDRPAVP